MYIYYINYDGFIFYVCGAIKIYSLIVVSELMTWLLSYV